jgi:hypothetical protein
MHPLIEPAIFLEEDLMMNPKPHLHELTPTEVHHSLHDRADRRA